MQVKIDISVQLLDKLSEKTCINVKMHRETQFILQFYLLISSLVLHGQVYLNNTLVNEATRTSSIRTKPPIAFFLCFYLTHDSLALFFSDQIRLLTQGIR